MSQLFLQRETFALEFWDYYLEFWEKMPEFRDINSELQDINSQFWEELQDTNTESFFSFFIFATE